MAREITRPSFPNVNDDEDDDGDRKRAPTDNLSQSPPGQLYFGYKKPNKNMHIPSRQNKKIRPKKHNINSGFVLFISSERMLLSLTLELG